MARREFSKETRRAARARSGGKCEGVGTLYGFPTGVRCNRDLSYGVHFDHVDGEAVSHDNSLENCAAVCPPCNMHKAHTYDTPRAAKTKRQSDKDAGIRKRSTMPGSRDSRWKKKMDGRTERRP
jgi:5-methylcytosine-specific restriction protein A